MSRSLPQYLCCLAILFAACRQPEPLRHFPLKGQVLAIGTMAGPASRRQVTVKHEDIPGFMPAMTMAYFVEKPGLLEGLEPGDLVTARLVVAGSEAYLDQVTKTGRAALPADARPVKAMEVMAAGDEVPDDELVDQQGHRRKLSEWRGKALAVTFVYTRCPLPDFCPLMDRQFAELQRAIAADSGLRERAHLVSVSFDPARDTPAVITAHAAARGADPRTWSYVTGTPDAVDHLTSRFGISTIREKDTPESITHNLRTAIVDPRGRLVKMYSGNEWTVDALLADLRDAIR